MKLAFNVLCDRVDRLAEKWRPYVQGNQQLKVNLTRADTGEPMGSRVLTVGECNALAHAEMDPLVLEAMDLAKRL